MATESEYSPGRRRSSRLIATPWVFYWPKKPPVFVNLGEDEIGNSTPKVDAKYNSGKKKGSLGVISPPGVVGRLETSEDDDDFVTPLEKFSSSGSKRPARLKIRTGESSSMCTSIRGKKARLGRSLCKSPLVAEVGKKSGMELVDSPAKDSTANAAMQQKKKASRPREVMCKNNKAKECGTNRGKAAVEEPDKEPDKHKKTRTYDRYLQNKFSPGIITDMIVNLSEAQSNWVKKAGFEHLLLHRNRIFPHRIAYNVVEAFDSERCALVLQAGTVLITERLVHNVLGLPLGESEIRLSKSRIAKSAWDEQYETTQITPIMIKDKILESPFVDYNFKMNFLILMYNFLIEANQNRYVKRDFLSFGGNIDEIGRYNWCSLLLRKLKVTHDFWADGKWRNFAGPLPCLIFSYVYCVQSSETVHPANTIPWYHGWTDNMLREREKNEESTGRFGVGVIISTDAQFNETAGSSGGARDVTMRDMVVPDSLSGGDDVDVQTVCGNEMSGMGNEVDAVLDGITENIEYILEELQDLRNEEEMTEVLDTRDKVDVNNTWSHVVAVQDMNDGVNATEHGTGVTSVLAKVVQDVEHNKPIEGQSTQARADSELDEHFDEEPYMMRFEQNLKELDSVYNRCLTNFVDSLALYPQNKKLAELKTRYKQFFKFFGESSPLTKSLSTRCGIQCPKKKLEVNMNDIAPSFSLGLSQMSPKNLGDAMDTCMFTPEPSITVCKQTKGRSETVMLHEPVKARPRRDIMPTAICRSPYVTRLTDISRHIFTAEEKDVWDWLCNDKTNDSDYIFEWKDRACTKAQFQSLEVDKPVEATVIDTWTYMLNENEIFRAESSPLRMFLTTETSYGPMQMMVRQGDLDAKLNRYAAFDDNMEVVLNLVNKIHGRTFNITDFELFLFPVYTGVHHYIICYNVKKPRWEIIDNRVQEMSMEDTYGDLPWRLHDCFCQFLECFPSNNHREIVNLKPDILTMDWQTLDNAIDCGVFVMRHLESYMGNKASWSCGLRSETDNQKCVLQKLRTIYAHRMLMWTKNKKRHLILQKMVNYSRRKLLG